MTNYPIGPHRDPVGVMLFNASNARKLHYTLQSDSDVINASAVCSVLISYGL